MKIQHNIFFFIFSFCCLLMQAQNFNLPPVLNGPVYNLNMQNGTRQFNAGVTSSTKGFNGNVLGPTLIMQKGQHVYMNVTNSIGEETTVHWHGFHVAAEHDGGPHTIIDPNTTWSPDFPVLDKAGTYWYHPHAHELTSKHVIQGLAGMIIVKDDEEAALDLPRTYGVDDFPLIIQTKSIDAAGVIEFDGQPSNADTNLMVNAVKYSALNVPRQMVRFRILNASNQRVFNLGLSNNSVFYHIATDGGLKPSRASVTRLRLAPGERGEIVVPFGSYAVGTNLTLRSYANELPSGTWGAAVPWINAINETPNYTPNHMNGVAFTVLRFSVVAATANPVTAIPPATLSVNTAIPEAQATFTRHKWLFSGNGINGVRVGATSNYSTAGTFDMNVVSDVIPLDRTEIWTLHGAADQYHPFHIHDIQFFILDRKDSNGVNIPLTSNEIGRKDVVYVGPKETVRFITKFDDFWGDVPYMYHCHITVHEDRGMMKQFTINSTVYVNRDYAGSLENGSLFAPYKKLSTAVAAANNGSTIVIIQPGLHEEIVSTAIITTKKLTIKPLAGSVTFQ